MCVIIAKPKKGDSPPIEHFKKAMLSNPHGFSLALKMPGKPWQVFRTMSESAMLYYIENKGVLNKSSKWIFHARIKTHGPSELKNCHCWRDKRTDTIFAHNGTLGIEADKGKTDSETFFRRIFVPLYQHEGAKVALKAAKAICNSSSKLAIIMEKEQKQIALVGNWIKRNNIYYSNYTAFPFSLQDDDEDYGKYWQRKAKTFGEKLCEKNTITPSHWPATPSLTGSSPQTYPAQPVSNRKDTPLGLLT